MSIIIPETNSSFSYDEISKIPIDGFVVTYNDIPYSELCGKTNHHYNDSIAFKL